MENEVYKENYELKKEIKQMEEEERCKHGFEICMLCGFGLKNEKDIEDWIENEAEKDFNKPKESQGDR